MGDAGRTNKAPVMDVGSPEGLEILTAERADARHVGGVAGRDAGAHRWELVKGGTADDDPRRASVLIQGEGPVTSDRQMYRIRYVEVACVGRTRGEDDLRQAQFKMSAEATAAPRRPVARQEARPGTRQRYSLRGWWRAAPLAKRCPPGRWAALAG